MIDKRFRKEEFDKWGKNSPRGEALLTELNIEILNELDKTLRVKLEEIASKLNQLGHKLDVIEVEDVAPAYRSYEYADYDGHSKENYMAHGLRFSLETMIFSGYPGYSLQVQRK